MKAENISGKSGKVKNQFVITTADTTYFQSYDTTIVKVKVGNKIQLDKNAWNCSKTTSKYRSIFLNESTKETERKIKEGIYELVDLNSEEIK